MLKCADCDETNPQWGSLNRGVVLCDDCSSVHRHLGRHVSQIKHLTKSRWRKTQLAMLKTLAQSGANKYWEHILLESSLRNGPNNNNSSVNESNNISIKFRKPTPKDPKHPTKNDFIKEKYLFFGFFKKPRAIVVDDLNQQLHASVRTGFLETSLYLLTLGARPNYTHPTRQTTPLHVAAMYNQPLQVELLLTYGADLLITDGGGDTALQIAYKKAQPSPEPLKWQVLITCLLEAQFEITDSLSYYLCRQTIDHSLNDLNDPSKMINNFLIPKLTADNVISNSKQNLEKARGRLQHLPNDAFVDLCLDICDEVDRRDTNDILSSVNSDKDLTLFFLPPNPNYSPTRNQGRQKLARLSLQEFRTLCHDVLVQASMRLSPQTHVYQLYSSQRPQSKKHRSSLPLGTSLDSCVAVEEHDPVYDQVATDGDYSYVMDLHRSQGSPLQNLINGQKNTSDVKHTFHGAFKNNRISMPVEIIAASSAILQSQEQPSGNEEKSVNNLLNKIDDLTGRNKLLHLRNNDLEKKVKNLELQISQLKDEKAALIAALSANKSGKQALAGSNIRSRNHSNNTESSDSCDYQDNLEDVTKLLKSSQIPLMPPPSNAAISSNNESAYDTGSDRFSSGPWLRQEILNKGNQMPSNTGSPLSLVHKKSFDGNNKTNMENMRMFPGPQGQMRNYDNSDSICNSQGRAGSEPREDTNQNSPSSQSSNNTPTTQTICNLVTDMPPKCNMYHLPDYDTPPMEEFITAASNDNTSNQVVNGVETIILQIRALLDIANGKKRGDFLHCSRAIQSAVQHLVRLFSSTERRYVNNPVISSQISTALRDLLANSRDLRIRCEKKSNISNRGGVPNEQDTAPVIQHAHEIARAAKMLLTHYQQEDN